MNRRRKLQGAGGRPAHIATCLLLSCLVFQASNSHAQTPPPPGGHLPVHYGGYNASGYPTSVSVPEPGQGGPPRAIVVASPNPSLGAITLRMRASEREKVTLRIFGPDGRLVGHWRGVGNAGGIAEHVWDARDTGGRRLPAGVYTYLVQVGNRTSSGRVVILK